ncbi:MAG: c-type cytochrome [Candidatus Eiseniibacteriota bacterium]
MIVVTLAVVAVAAVAALGWAPWRAAPAGRADADDAVQVARGEVVYAERCASCHGVRLEGQADWRQRKPDGKLPAPPHDDSGHSWHHADAQLFGITKFGLEPYAPKGYVSDMPAFKDVLSDADIWAALAFIKSRWSAEIRARQASIDRRARQSP